MKAIVFTRYGSADGLQLIEVEKPAPRDNQVLIKIAATTVTAGDCEIRRSDVPILFWLPIRIWIGLRQPRKNTILGMELAGKIKSTGSAVKRFKKGNKVFAASGMGLGAYAEYICLPEDGALALKPANSSYEEAAAVPIGGLEALHFLRKANIQRGQKLLIVGAGGSIGTYAVQIAKYFGAVVTGVDRTGKLDMLRAIGADQVIDYTQEDFTRSGQTYDIIFDVVGKSSFSGCIRSLKQNGRYLLANPGPSHMVRGLWISMTSSKKVIIGASNAKAEDLVFLKNLIEAGTIKPVIDRSYPLEEIAAAHRYAESGQKKGNLVITV